MYETSNSLAPYIEQYGWENIEHKVLIDGLSKKQAEDRLIQALSMNWLCINERRSGGIRRNDKQAYDKEYRKQYDKQRLSTPERIIYYRVRNYNKYHTPIETPMEGKQKYLQWGYIPVYVKNDDL